MTGPEVSPRRRREVIDALRRGTVPVSGLDLLAVGLERFTPGAARDLYTAADGRSAFKAVRRQTPACAQRLRAYHAGTTAGKAASADALAAWLGGQPNVAAAARRSAGIRGELDHFGAMGFLQGLLAVLRDAGHPGLFLVLDEGEALQAGSGAVRARPFKPLRQLIAETSAGRYPALCWG